MPLRRLTLPATRVAGSATTTQWNVSNGVALSVYNCINTANGGYYTAPVELPLDCDVSYPIQLYQWVRNPTLLATSHRLIAFLTVISYVSPPDPVAQIIQDQFWATPDNWAQAAYARIRLVADATPDDPSIPGNTLAPGSIIGVRSWRNGLTGGDTFEQNVQLLASLVMEYHVRCQTPGCC